MTQAPTDAPSCPPEILEWLPWYVDDGLAESQRGAVEAHAAQCEACRAEIAMLSGAMPEHEAPGADAVFADVLARIEASGVVAGHEVAARGPRVPAPAHRAPPRTMTRDRRPPLGRIAAAASALLVVAAAGWLAHDFARPDRGSVYRTATDAGAGTGAATGSELDVVFLPDVSIDRINTDLRAIGAVVVAGPSEAGRYRVRLPAGATPAAAAAMLRAEGSGVATFAEPVRP